MSARIFLACCCPLALLACGTPGRIPVDLPDRGSGEDAGANHVDAGAIAPRRDAGPAGEDSCSAGDTTPCYDGPPTTDGVGACREGVAACEVGLEFGTWGACVGQVLPASDETCDDGDDADCDGVVDEGCGCLDGETRPCSTVCGAGVQTCSAGAFGACSAREPTEERCGNAEDDDCDGDVDETCAPPPPPGMCESGSYTHTRFSSGAVPEVHVVGVYEARSPHDRSRSFPATVHVARVGVPIVLVLSSYEAVEWRVSIDPGVIIERVILNGFYSSSVAGISVPVDDRSGRGRFLSACAFRWPDGTGGCSTADLISGLMGLGLDVSSFRGCYRGTSFRVD